MTDAAAAENEGPKVEHALEVLESHMPQTKELDAVEIALKAIDSNKHLMDVACHIKTEYDKKYPGNGKATEGVYHAVCGHHFASCVSHETREYCHIKVDEMHIIIWKSKDTPFKPDLGT